MSEYKKLRPRCFFDIKIGEKDGMSCLLILFIIKILCNLLYYLVGRITFELFNDICPMTCENFKALCTGLLI